MKNKLVFCFIYFFSIFDCVLLNSCANNDFDKKGQTEIELSIFADSNVNPDSDARPSPIYIRIYDLKDSASFETTDYFTLISADKNTLGQDILKRDEYIFHPGEKKNIKRKCNPDMAALGFLASYRDLSQSTWRAVYKVKPLETSWYNFYIPTNKVKLKVYLQSRGIQLATEN